jgi:sugar phosphate isomerase/epimerase
MRLGGKVTPSAPTPEAWVAAVQAKGYRAAYAPVGIDADSATIAAYRRAAEAADIMIAEVGAWSNPLDANPATRQAAMDKCIASLRLADTLGARCCVNIAGSRGTRWDGPHPDNLSDGTFDLIVNTVQEIIDTAQPKETAYTLETMPWVLPDSVASYENLLNAINRPGFGVHFDPVNLVNSPSRYFYNADLIREFVAELGPHIRSVHVKDILLHEKLTTHLDEVAPGQGALAIDVLLRSLYRLERDLPVMLEHLPDDAAYDAAAAHVRHVAAQEGIAL